MKKSVVRAATIAIILICIIGFIGYQKAVELAGKEATTYSFSGEHTYFTVSKGSIIFNEEGQKFDGGELAITYPAIFENVTSFSTFFYTLRNGSRDPFHSTSATGLTGDSAPDRMKLGSGSSSGIMISNLEQGLWFELITVDKNGAEKVYPLELTLTE